ncbi:hypothetical protein, partial [Brachyspira hampsonii]|uniref:hypothetical protein n=1 Tax=Brachyspira hampsonii TaxID=1287055 RepID=UPI000AF4E815
MGLNVSIYADASQAIEAFGKLKDKTTDLERGFDKIGKSFDKFGSLANCANSSRDNSFCISY